MIALGILAGSASAATRFVASTGSDEAGNECLSSSAPCQTVQRGIDEAEAGDTISIAAGTYRERIRVNRKLTLVGQGSSTVLEGGSTDPSAVSVLADSTLEDLRIRGGLDVTEAEGAVFIGGEAGTEVSFDDVVAEQAPGAREGEDAVYVGAGNALTMRSSTIADLGRTGLIVFGSAKVIDSDIAVNPVTREGEGIFAGGGARVDVVGSSIRVSGDTGPGLMSEGAAVTATDSTFSARNAIWASAGSAVITRDKLMASNDGLLLQEGVTVGVRDSLISPSPGGELPAGVLVNPEGVPTALTIVGSTVYAEGRRYLPGSSAVEVGAGEGEAQVRIFNSILRAVEPDGAPHDLRGEASWSVAHSDFTTSGFADPAPGTGTNVAAVPIFTQQAVGNYELTAADTSLLDAGDPAQVLPGETDLAGQPRMLAGTCGGVVAPDLGAYELVRTESCPVPPAVESGEAAHRAEPTVEPEVTTAPSGPKSAKPKLTGVKVKTRRKGPVLVFTLSEPAKVRVKIAKAITRAAARISRASHHRKARYRNVATIVEHAGKGAHAIPLASHLRSRKMTHGSFRLTLVATAGGMRSVRRTAFTLRHRQAARGRHRGGGGAAK